MSSRTLELFYLDVIVAIYKIQIVSDKFSSADDLLHDFVSWDSVIREFEIIGEATKVLLQNSVLDEKFRIVVDFRNLISHQYFGIDQDAVWSVIKNNLLELQGAIIIKIEELEVGIFNRVVESTLSDLVLYPEVLSRVKEQFK